MSTRLEEPWSNNPFAPRIPRSVYLEEKASFAGALIGATLYGIVIAPFSQCMGALLDPVKRRTGDVKWGLVAHTVVMFSVVTVYTASTLSIASDSYIDNREFPGVDGALPPGPSGYQYFTYFKPINVVCTVMFLLNNWLADALLLYRCYVIYSMNYWATAFPCLVYLASLATGVIYIYRSSQPVSVAVLATVVDNFGILHHSISVSLNVLLTLMIVTRLVLHNREIRNVLGSPATANGLYNAVIIVLTESCALFAISFLVFVGLWFARNPVADVFFPILVQTQVIAPFLIIPRVVNRNLSTTNTSVSNDVGLVRFQPRGRSVGSEGTLVRGSPTPRSSTETCGGTPYKLGAGVGAVIDLHPDV